MLTVFHLANGHIIVTEVTEDGNWRDPMFYGEVPTQKGMVPNFAAMNTYGNFLLGEVHAPVKDAHILFPGYPANSQMCEFYRTALDRIREQTSMVKSPHTAEAKQLMTLAGKHRK